MTDKRDQLQDIAQEHVQRGGLKNFSFRALAEEAGIKSSSVHYYFPEKADLGEALIERYSSALMSELKTISEHQWNLKKKLGAFVKIFESVAKDDLVCLCGMLAAEHDNLPEKNREQIKNFFLDMEKWLSTLLKKHKEELNTPMPALPLARSIISGLEGALLLDRAAGNNSCMAAQKTLIMGFLAEA